MATCKDCLHFDACMASLKIIFPALEDKEITHIIARETNCRYFKSAANVISIAEVREIFEDIDTILLGHLMGNYDIEDTMDAIRKLKKKRTGERKT